MLTQMQIIGHTLYWFLIYFLCGEKKVFEVSESEHKVKRLHVTEVCKNSTDMSLTSLLNNAKWQKDTPAMIYKQKKLGAMQMQPVYDSHHYGWSSFLYWCFHKSFLKTSNNINTNQPATMF